MRKAVYDKLDPAQKEIYRLEARKSYYNRKGDSARAKEISDKIMEIKLDKSMKHKKAAPAPESIDKPPRKPDNPAAGRDLFSVIEEIFRYGCESVALRKGNIDITCSISG